MVDVYRFYLAGVDSGFYGNLHLNAVWFNSMIEKLMKWGTINVPNSTEVLKDRLSRYRQIELSVIGRKSGRMISIPVWFVEGENLYLLPEKGSDTQWYQNVLENPTDSC